MFYNDTHIDFEQDFELDFVGEGFFSHDGVMVGDVPGVVVVITAPPAHSLAGAAQRGRATG